MDGCLAGRVLTRMSDKFKERKVSWLNPDRSCPLTVGASDTLSCHLAEPTAGTSRVQEP